jgi:hypothetical protein
MPLGYFDSVPWLIALKVLVLKVLRDGMISKMIAVFVYFYMSF